MESNIEKTAIFCRLVRARSFEHAETMRRVHDLPGTMLSILRQELDSMVKAIYLLVMGKDERARLIDQTLQGEKWTVKTAKGKHRQITDKDMVDLSNRLHGWSQSVYKFGCAFIHLSTFHDYRDRNPFNILSDDERSSILEHLRYYHGGPQSDNPSFEEFSQYFPRVFEKISNNLECYLTKLENGETVE